MLLECIAHRSPHPGADVMLEPTLDYPLFDAASTEECKFLIQHVRESGYIYKSDVLFGLTAKGWEAVQAPNRGTGRPGRCFVAMSFDEALDPAYLEGIRPAVEQDCGCTAVRMKELHHNIDICDELLSEIRLAQFVVADFTQHKGGVYYEAGFARALGREVINSCHADDFDRLHFDTNHLNHIKWSTPAELREKLADRITATIDLP
jgi:hypothetical protein